MGYNALNDQIRDNVRRMAVRGPPSAKRWPPCAACNQRKKKK